MIASTVFAKPAIVSVSLIGCLVVFAAAAWAQPAPLKFVYSGAGGSSASTADLEGLQNAWDSIPESRGKSGIDLRTFVDARFVNEAL